MPAPHEHPCVAFFPALPLAVGIELGEWRVGAPPAEAPWCSEKFKSLAQSVISSFGPAGFRNCAQVWHGDRGFDGQAPSDKEIEALQAAIRFAVLDANDQVRDDPNAGHYLATTENCALFVQPIDVTSGWITHRQGGALRRVLSGGWKIGEQPLPLPDAVVAIQQPVRASRKLASAVFDVFMDQTVEAHRHVRIAMEWHAVAMANPLAVTLQQRLIALKTGFEALLGTSNSRKGAQRLRKLFEDVTASHREMLPWAGILWSPKEHTDLPRTFDNQPDPRSELEDWFMTLAKARNSVIHDGELSITEYAAPPERPLSRYAGLLFWVGERLLREAIKARLGAGLLLCGRITEWAAFQPLLDALRAARAGEADSEDAIVEAADPVAPIEPGRDLATLLAELGCDAANQVELQKAVGGVSGSEQAASEMAAALRDSWAATAGPRSVLIGREGHARGGRRRT